MLETTRFFTIFIFSVLWVVNFFTLNCILKKDIKSKIAALSFCLTYLMASNLNLLNQKQFQRKSFYESNVLGNRLYSLLLQNKFTIQSFLYHIINAVLFFSSILVFNSCSPLPALILINVMGLLYALSEQLHLQILNQQHLFSMMLISIGSYVLLVVLDLLLKNTIKTQQIDQISQTNRRKIFHLLPLITIPVLHILNSNLLNIMLCGSFYVLLNLELLRYALTFYETNPIYASRNSFLLKVKNLIIKLTNPVFDWMKSFNNIREKHFWFTHLFLYLGIIISCHYYKQSSTNKYLISLLLILADGMAALVGFNFGKHKMHQNKTVQGFLAYFLTMVISQYIFLNAVITLPQILIGSIACAICQLLSGDLDNILCLIVFIAIDKVFMLS